MSSSKIYQIIVLAAGLFVTSLCGCRAGQSNGPALFQQPNIISNTQNLGRQLGQRASGIAVNRIINEGITQVINGF